MKKSILIISISLLSLGIFGQTQQVQKESPTDKATLLKSENQMRIKEAKEKYETHPSDETLKYIKELTQEIENSAKQEKADKSRTKAVNDRNKTETSIKPEREKTPEEKTKIAESKKSLEEENLKTLQEKYRTNPSESLAKEIERKKMILEHLNNKIKEYKEPDKSDKVKTNNNSNNKSNN